MKWDGVIRYSEIGLTANDLVLKWNISCRLTRNGLVMVEFCGDLSACETLRANPAMVAIILRELAKQIHEAGGRGTFGKNEALERLRPLMDTLALPRAAWEILTEALAENQKIEVPTLEGKQ